MKYIIQGLFLVLSLVSAQPYFNRIASFPVYHNIPAGTDVSTETSAEIIAATEDGMMLVYSDSPSGAIGMIDIRDPANPKAAGAITFEGEPTSVAMAAGHVLVAVNTSESFANPSGFLEAIDIKSKTASVRCDLGGQPDAVAVSPDKSLLAVAIENERDEDVNEGELPQLPAGYVLSFLLNDKGVPDCSSRKTFDLTGLAEIGADDPEPEFVDINQNNEIALTLQENNHIVILDGNNGTILHHFSAGTVDLEGIDTLKNGTLEFDSQRTAVPREPDAVKWLDTERIVIANEGDYKGGSRGFSIFNKTGQLLFESGPAFEYQIALAGHYPEMRSHSKGVEPEGLEVKTFGEDTFIFVLSERGSVIGVYKDTDAEPEFVQLLPSGLSPEGVVAIPQRNLLAVANEVDLVATAGVRSHVTLYSYPHQQASYPMIVSDFTNDVPIGWGALSGLVADPEQAGILYAVSDSFYAMQPTIFTIDANQTPARITKASRVTRNGASAQLLDLEGISSDGRGGFWLASEGRSDRLIPHALYRVNAQGEIKEQVAFPSELLAVETRWGAEGITMIGDTLWIAIQRQWQDDPDNTVKLLSYNPTTKAWGAVRYPTEPAEVGWVGLSEITAHGDYVYILERDDQIGEAAKIKKLYRVAISQLQAAALGSDLPLVTKEEVRDFLPDLRSTGGYAVDKIEGFAIDAGGMAYAVTDNDGVDGSNGETLFLQIGLFE